MRRPADSSSTSTGRRAPSPRSFPARRCSARCVPATAATSASSRACSRPGGSRATTTWRAAADPAPRLHRLRAAGGPAQHAGVVGATWASTSSTLKSAKGRCGSFPAATASPTCATATPSRCTPPRRAWCLAKAGDAVLFHCRDHPRGAASWARGARGRARFFSYRPGWAAPLSPVEEWPDEVVRGATPELRALLAGQNDGDPVGPEGILAVVPAGTGEE